MDANKIFSFAIEIDGIDQFLIQEVKEPEVEIGAVAHGASNYDVKTAGGIAVSDAELMKIKKAVGGDSWAWDWLTAAQDPDNGSSVEAAYKKTVIFKELAPDGITTVNAYMWIGCWVRKVTKTNRKRGNQNENVIETITLSVDKVKKIK